MSTVLAIDTSSGSTGAAVLKGGAVAAAEVVVEKNRHSHILFNQIDTVMARAGVAKAELECIAVTRGPGAFTGLRVGVATAKGLADGLGLPIAGVSGLRALAYTVTPFDGVIVPMFDARKGQVYASVLDGRGDFMADDVELVGEGAHLPEELAEKLKALGRPCLFIGSGVGAYGEVLKEKLGELFSSVGSSMWHIDPGAVATLGSIVFESGKAQDPATFAPVYHRLSEAEVMRTKA